MKNIFFVALFLGSLAVWGQKTEVTFKVSGICEMCKARIEKSLDIPGVWFAEWSPETQTAHVVYKTDKISEKEVHQTIANAGHDTELIKATDEAYAKVHGCCRYRDEAVVNQHQN